MSQVSPLFSVGLVSIFCILIDEGSYLDNVFFCRSNYGTRWPLPVVTVDANSRRVLMQAWVNSGHRKSRFQRISCLLVSIKGKLWKGTVREHTENIDVYLDCDNDSLLCEVHQKGGIACHTGRESCFYQKYKDGKWLVNIRTQRPVFHL